MENGGSCSESPVETKKGKSKTPRKAKECVLKQKSPAEFFAENKNICRKYDCWEDNGKGMPHDDIPNMFGRGR